MGRGDEKRGGGGSECSSFALERKKEKSAPMHARLGASNHVVRWTRLIVKYMEYPV